MASEVATNAPTENKVDFGRSEAEIKATIREKRKNQTPRRKMYTTAKSNNQFVLLIQGSELNELALKRILSGLEKGLSRRSLGLGKVSLQLYPSELVRLYPDAKKRKLLNREYRAKYYERNPAKKELSEAQKRKRKEYNERPDVKRRKMETNRMKRMFLNQKLEENEDEYELFVQYQKRLAEKTTDALTLNEFIQSEMQKNGSASSHLLSHDSDTSTEDASRDSEEEEEVIVS